MFLNEFVDTIAKIRKAETPFEILSNTENFIYIFEKEQYKRRKKK